MIAERIADSGLSRSIIFNACNAGIDVMNNAGTIAKYFATSLELVIQYLEVFGPAMAEEHRQKFIGKHVAFRTLLEEV